jgi:DNA replication protein DnaC
MNHINQDLAAAIRKAQQAFDQARLTGRLKPSVVGEYEKEKAVRERQRVLEWCGIHARFAETTFAAIEQQGIASSMGANFNQAKEYAEKWDKHTRTGTGLILKGQVGTLKTSLAVAVLQELIQRGRHGFFITMPSLLDTIFTLKEGNIEEWLAFENKLKNTGLLILDDLGAEYQKGWVMTKIDAIISERYNRCRPIIITTNLTIDQMKNTYAEHIIDRLRSTCLTLTFCGQSQRKAVAV